MLEPFAIRIGIDTEEWNKLSFAERLEQIGIVNDILQKIAADDIPLEPGAIIASSSKDAITA